MVSPAHAGHAWARTREGGDWEGGSQCSKGQPRGVFLPIAPVLRSRCLGVAIPTKVQNPKEVDTHFKLHTTPHQQACLLQQVLQAVHRPAHHQAHVPVTVVCANAVQGHDVRVGGCARGCTPPALSPGPPCPRSGWRSAWLRRSRPARPHSQWCRRTRRPESRQVHGACWNGGHARAASWRLGQVATRRGSCCCCCRAPIGVLNIGVWSGDSSGGGRGRVSVWTT
jgi:hypothetical protein